MRSILQPAFSRHTRLPVLAATSGYTRCRILRCAQVANEFRMGFSSYSSAALARSDVRVHGRSHGRQALRCNALFEKFTERSIKSVMIAQNEAKGSGATEVGVAC